MTSCDCENGCEWERGTVGPDSKHHQQNAFKRNRIVLFENLIFSLCHYCYDYDYYCIVIAVRGDHYARYHVTNMDKRQIYICERAMLQHLLFVLSHFANALSFSRILFPTLNFLKIFIAQVILFFSLLFERNSTWPLSHNNQHTSLSTTTMPMLLPPIRVRGLAGRPLYIQRQRPGQHFRTLFFFTLCGHCRRCFVPFVLL